MRTSGFEFVSHFSSFSIRDIGIETERLFSYEFNCNYSSSYLCVHSYSCFLIFTVGKLAISMVLAKG